MNGKKIDSPPLPLAARALAEEERLGLHFVPTEAGLIAYQAGDLTDGEEEQIRAYLALDPQAARFVADLDQFLDDAEDESQHLSEHESARVQRNLQAALAREPAPANDPLPDAERPFRAVSKGWAIAASVLVLLTGASVVWGILQGSEAGKLEDRLASVEQDLEDARNLPPEAPKVMLRSSRPAAGSGTRGPGDVRGPVQIELTSTERYFSLVVPKGSAAGYRAEVRAAGGEIVQPGWAPEPVPGLPFFVINLAVHHFPAGHYELRLTVPEHPEVETEVFPFSVTYTGQSVGESP